MDGSCEFDVSIGRYAFHSTQRENAKSIREQGIRRDHELAHDSTDILNILDDLGYDDPFPFDRRAVTYCHIDGAYVMETMQQQEESAFASDDAVIVVDVTALDAPMYLADMSIITDLIDYRYAGERHMMFADTPEEAVEKYQESVQRVESPAEFEAYDRDAEGHVELVIDGDVPPSAIRAVRS